MTGAQLIIKELKELDVKHVFAMPGFQNLEIFDSFFGSEIKNTLVTNDLNALFMSDGYYRATGKTGVCLATPGPGLSNMLSGIAEAYADSSAIVIILTGLNKSKKQFRIHEVKQQEMIKPVLKKLFIVDDLDCLSAAIQDAFRLAQEGEPGPVGVEIDQDILKKNILLFKNGKQKENKKAEKKADTDNLEDKLKQITEILLNCETPVLYAGRGAMDASYKIRRLSQMLSIPVATTVSGKGVFPEDHALSLGVGFSSIAAGMIGKCDVLLAVGCKFSEIPTGAWSLKMPKMLIHIDKNSNVFNKNYQAALTLCSDAQVAVSGILKLLEKDGLKEKINRIDRIQRDKKKFSYYAGKEQEKGIIDPRCLLSELRSIAERDAIMCTDCGNHQLWAISEFPVFEPRTFLSPVDYQAMGFGLPAAIGAKIGSPGKEVICLCGDGSFLMNGFELLTAKREKLDLKIIIANDGALGLIKELQNRNYGRSTSVDLSGPDFRLLAESFGINYIEINKRDELAEKLRHMMSLKGVVLTNVRICYDQPAPYIISVNNQPMAEKITRKLKGWWHMMHHKSKEEK
ncbi:MAG: thiamine pyrophosphate-binding protein [Candidatus Omnitrophota bacterium]